MTPILDPADRGPEAPDLTALRALAETVRHGHAPTMNDKDWDDLAGKAVDAGYDEALIRRRQRNDMSFTYATIGAAFQLGWRKAAGEAPVLLAAIEREMTRTELMAYQRGAVMDVIMRLNARDAVDRVEEILAAGMTDEVRRGYADQLGAVLAEVDRLTGELAKLREKTATWRNPEDPGEKRWSDAIDWLLNSSHCGDPDIQAAFWGMVDGQWNREVADRGYIGDRPLVELRNEYEEGANHG